MLTLRSRQGREHWRKTLEKFNLNSPKTFPFILHFFLRVFHLNEKKSIGMNDKVFCKFNLIMKAYHAICRNKKARKKHLFGRCNGFYFATFHPRIGSIAKFQQHQDQHPLKIHLEQFSQFCKAVVTLKNLLLD